MVTRLVPNPDGGLWIQTLLAPIPANIRGLALSPDGGYLATAPNSRGIYSNDGTKVTGNGFGAVDGVGLAASFKEPFGIATTNSGATSFITDSSAHDVRKMEFDGGFYVVTTVSGQQLDAGIEDGPAATARFNQPHAIAVDRAGTLGLTEFDQDVVRSIGGGIVRTLAGSPGHRGSVDGASATARFDPGSSVGLAMDPAYNIYVADSNNGLIRKIAPDGTVSTYAGVANFGGALDGLAASAGFAAPTGLAYDPKASALYVADRGECSIRAVTYDPSFKSNIVTTIAGTSPGNQSFNCSSSDGEAQDAGFANPTALALDSHGRIFVADQGSNYVRMVARADGGGDWFVTTVAGNGHCVDQAGSPGICQPSGVAVDPQDNVFVSDNANNQIFRVSADGGGWVVTKAIPSTGCSYVDGDTPDAGLCHPTGLSADKAGGILIADTGNHAVRRMTYNATKKVYSLATVSGTAGAPQQSVSAG